MQFNSGSNNCASSFCLALLFALCLACHFSVLPICSFLSLSLSLTLAFLLFSYYFHHRCFRFFVLLKVSVLFSPLNNAADEENDWKDSWMNKVNSPGLQHLNELSVVMGFFSPGLRCVQATQQVAYFPWNTYNLHMRKLLVLHVCLCSAMFVCMYYSVGISQSVSHTFSSSFLFFQKGY